MKKSPDPLALAHQQNRELRNELERREQPLRQRIRELEAELAEAKSKRSSDSLQLMIYIERSDFYWRSLQAMTALVHHLMTRKEKP